jgi:hypothetical protein
MPVLTAGRFLKGSSGANAVHGHIDRYAFGKKNRLQCSSALQAESDISISSP